MKYHHLKARSPYFIVGFGVIMFLISVFQHVTELFALQQLVGPIVAFLIDGPPALGLAYSGYRLTGTDLSSDDRWQVWLWCVGGALLFGIVMSLSLFVRAFEGRVIGEPLFPLLLAIEAGAIAGVVGGYQTGRARTETRRARSASEALRERTRQLQGVLNGVKAAIWIRDTDGRYVLVNENFRTLFGIGADTEVSGKRPTEVIPEKAAKDVRDNDQQVLETRQPLEIEETVQTEQGTRTFLTRINPLFEDGDLYATCGIATDITEQKEYERTIEQQNERLDQFASVVSHDLRNPLNVADGKLELARMECDNEHLADVDRALERMNDLITDLLALAREQEKTVDLEPVDLPAMTEQCWANVDTGNATLVTDVECTIHADRSRLKQLLENLIRNAVEHGNGDVTVTIGELNDGFYVEDTGPGIPEEQRDEVFDAGYTTSDEGTGFGLNIVEEVVNGHGWEITVTEGSEGGARFEITDIDVTE